MPPPITKVTITLSGNQVKVDQDPAPVEVLGRIKWVKSSGIIDFKILPHNNIFDPASLPPHYSWNNHPVTLLPIAHVGDIYEYTIEYTTSSGKDTLDPKIAVMPHKKFFFDVATPALTASFVILMAAVVIAAAVVRKRRLNRRKSKNV